MHKNTHSKHERSGAPDRIVRRSKKNKVKDLAPTQDFKYVSIRGAYRMNLIPPAVKSTMPVTHTLGGACGAASPYVVNSAELNSLDQTGAAPIGFFSNVTNEMCRLYQRYRVVGYNLDCVVSSKSAVTSNVLVAPYPSVGSSLITGAGTVLSYSTIEHSRFAVLGAIDGQNAVRKFRLRGPLSQVLGSNEYEQNDTYAAANTSSTGIPGTPSAFIYIWCASAPLSATSYVAANSDPLFQFTGSLEVLFYDRYQA